MNFTISLVSGAKLIKLLIKTRRFARMNSKLTFHKSNF